MSFGPDPSSQSPLVAHRPRYDPERLSICSVAANDDGPALDGLLAQGVHVDSRHRLRTVRGWHHERYTPLVAASSQVWESVSVTFFVE